MLDINEKDGLTIVRIKEKDSFNALIAEDIRSELLVHFSRTNTKMVFDLDGIQFIDSSGFGVFLAAMKAANNNYGQFKICNVDSSVKELFKVLQLHNVFDLYDSLQEAMDDFDH